MRAVNDSTGAPGQGQLGHRLRGTAVLLATALALTACGGDDTAATNHLGFEDGVAPGEEGLSTLEAVALYALAPLVVLLLIAAVVWLPGAVRGGRYRPGKGWGAAPLWFGGPADPAAAVESAQTGDLVRGGASGSW